MNPMLARLLIQLALDPEKLIKYLLAILIGFTLVFLMFFAIPIVMFKSVPLANDVQMTLYKNAAEELRNQTGVQVEWQQLVAVDAVLQNQDFTKVNKASVSALAHRFLRVDVVEEEQTTVDEQGVKHTHKVKVIKYHLRSLEEVMSDLALSPEQIQDVQRYLSFPLTIQEGQGVSLPPQEITQDIQAAIEIVHQSSSIVDPTWLSGMQILVMHESGGDPRIVNPEPVWYSPQWGYQHAAGLCQMMPPTFQRWMISGHSDIYNPVDNLIASMRYIVSRYGSVYNIEGIQFGYYRGY